VSSWQDINRDSWTFAKKTLVGAGGGVGEYLTSYAINTGAGFILNGKVSAEVRVFNKYGSGAGLVCRADDQWSFLAFYVAPTTEAASSTVARISAFRYGRLVPVVALSEPVLLSDDYSQFSLEFYAGRVRAELRSDERTYQLEALAPHIPFPGCVGVLKMYGAEVLVKNIMVEKTEMQFATPSEPAARPFDFDVFLCHSSADKELIYGVAKEFRDAGVKYWLDSDQIQFGASITQKIEDGLQRSRYVVPCLSESLAQSGWTRAEYGAVLNAEFSGASTRTVIPLKLTESMADSAIPLLLRDKKRVLYPNRMEFAQFVRFLLVS